MLSIIMGALKAEPRKDPLKELFETQVPLIFTLTELTWWKAILSKWFNIVVTFAWSFMDLFVMVVSIGLASQFKQINTDLQQMKGRVRMCYVFLYHHFWLANYFTFVQLTLFQFQFWSTQLMNFGYYVECNTVKWFTWSVQLMMPFQRLFSWHSPITSSLYAYRLFEA